MTKVTGNVLYHVKRLILEKFGKEKYDELLKNVSPESSEVLSEMIISSEWYELKIYEDLLDAFVNVFGEKELNNVQKELAKMQFTGLFGFFVKFVTPQKIMERANIMWKKIYSEGEAEVTEFSEKKITVMIKDFSFTRATFHSVNNYIGEIIKIVLKNENVTSKPRRLADKITQLDYFLD